MLQVSNSRHNHVGFGHRMMQRTFNKTLSKAVQRCAQNGLNGFHRRRPEHNRRGQRGVGFQLFQGRKQPRYAEIGVGVGKKQIFSVFG